MHILTCSQHTQTHTHTLNTHTQTHTHSHTLNTHNAHTPHTQHMHANTQHTHHIMSHVEKPLLSRATPLDRQFELRCSSHRASYPLTDTVLQFSDEPKFWVPADPEPFLEVEFRENQILTTIDTRGWQTHYSQLAAQPLWLRTQSSVDCQH